jgi:hypothetical protein
MIVHIYRNFALIFVNENKSQKSHTHLRGNYILNIIIYKMLGVL